MSPKEFIKSGSGRSQLTKAVRQQMQIRYLTVSEVQADASESLANSLTRAKYTGEDPLLEWVYSLFRKDNFKSFAKYLRFPVSSSLIVKEEIEKALNRVFFADDSYRKVTVNGKRIDDPEFLDSHNFKNEVFHSLLYNYNDIYIHDLEETNIPFRKLVSIKDVVAITTKGNRIKKIAYKGSLEINEEEVQGHIYMDDERFVFVPNEESMLQVEVPHDIDRCPATFVSGKAFDNQEPIVRDSIFSRVRPLLEEYVFLTTLRLMSDANGSFPIVVKLAAEAMSEKENDQDDSLPLASTSLAGHEQKQPENDLQAGSVITVPIYEKSDGSIDTDLAKNFINFFRTPVESLEYVDTRIEKVRKRIIESVVGDFVEQSDGAKNELQVSKSYIERQDKLRAISNGLSYCVTNSDEIMLKLANGTNVYVDCSFGTDFFIETQADLFAQYLAAPNPIEKSNILQRLTRIRGYGNDDKMERDVVLYKILPYPSATDFDKAVTMQIASQRDASLQIRFNFFITIFESTYGDIGEFWQSIQNENENQKLIFINNLLTKIIKDYDTEERAAAIGGDD
jgi:hypothetical protein